MAHAMGSAGKVAFATGAEGGDILRSPSCGSSRASLPDSRPPCRKGILDSR
jgi:hypothetical protein